MFKIIFYLFVFGITSCFYENPKNQIPDNKTKQIDQLRAGITPDSVIHVRKLREGNRLVISLKNNKRRLSLYTKGNDERILKEVDEELGGKSLGHFVGESKSSIIIGLQLSPGIKYLEFYNKENPDSVLHGKSSFKKHDYLGYVIFEGLNNSDGMIVLHDLYSGSFEYFDKPKNNICLSGDCWELLDLAEDVVKVGYKDNKKEYTVVRYDRSAKK